MKTDSISVPAVATVINNLLPGGCALSRCGLVFSPGIDREAWMAIGKSVTDLVGSSPWCIGDWLAHGDQFYTGRKGERRLPDGLYAKISAETGIAEQTLANAKCVALALPLSRRRDRLTFAHAAEIVGRADPAKYDFWINRVVTEGMSSKALRGMLRTAGAACALEPNDSGDVSFLETTRQFVRDYQAASGKLTPAYRAELAKILAPVLSDLG